METNYCTYTKQYTCLNKNQVLKRPTGQVELLVPLRFTWDGIAILYKDKPGWPAMSL